MGLIFVVLHIVVVWRSVDLPTFPVALANAIAGIWSIGVISNFQRNEAVPIWATVVASVTAAIGLGLGIYAVFA